jgi:hypothetical protein
MGSGVHAKALKASGQQARLMLSLECIGYFSDAPGFVVGIDFSDHLNYAHEGFVGMMVTDTAFYRNTAYHTPQDTADRLDYVRMGKVVDGVFRAVMTLDN